MTFASALAYWSGLAFVGPPLPPETVVGTTVALHICDAIVCRLIASNRGRSTGGWTVAGFIGGIWVVLALLVLPAPAEPEPPPRRLP